MRVRVFESLFEHISKGFMGNRVFGHLLHLRFRAYTPVSFLQLFFSLAGSTLSLIQSVSSFDKEGGEICCLLYLGLKEGQIRLHLRVIVSLVS